ncbi:SRPBCC family protein [Sphingomonas sp. YL-JM2C]
MGGQVVADIDAPVDRVWSFVGDFGNVQRWHPLVQGCDLAGEGVGSVRTIRFADWSVVERLDRHDPVSHELGYSILRSEKAELVGLRGTIRLVDNGSGGTRISWNFDQPPSPHRSATLHALEANYAGRVGHLRDALGLGAP